MRRLLVCLLASGLLCHWAWAFDPFVVRDIRVLGLQRISAGTVFNALPVKVGESLIHRLYTMLYLPVGLWSRLIARIIAFKGSLVSDVAMQCTRSSCLSPHSQKN